MSVLSPATRWVERSFYLLTAPFRPTDGTSRAAHLPVHRVRCRDSPLDTAVELRTPVAVPIPHEQMALGERHGSGSAASPTTRPTSRATTRPTAAHYGCRQTGRLGPPMREYPIMGSTLTLTSPLMPKRRRRTCALSGNAEHCPVVASSTRAHRTPADACHVLSGRKSNASVRPSLISQI